MMQKCPIFADIGRFSFAGEAVLLHYVRIPVEQKGKTMLRTTTPTVQGREIGEYLDIVVGEAILGSNFFKDMLGSIRDVVGGRSGAYEREMRNARNIAFAEMEDYARKLGADAVVGVDIDYEVIGQSGSMMMMVSVSGTAVKFK